MLGWDIGHGCLAGARDMDAWVGHGAKFDLHYLVYPISGLSSGQRVGAHRIPTCVYDFELAITLLWKQGGCARRFTSQKFVGLLLPLLFQEKGLSTVLTYRKVAQAKSMLSAKGVFWDAIALLLLVTPLFNS
eukprot:1143793-Pelagomonas_calceolata.AAC.1